MNEPTDNSTPARKLYKGKAFWVGTFLGGPLVAGYFLAENFKTLGQPEKVKPTWAITIIATLVIFVGVFLIPENVNIPSQIIPFAYTAIAFGLFNWYQKERATEHIKQGGVVYSWGKILGAGVIGLVITMVPIFVYGYVSDEIEQASISTKSYGETVKHEIGFDKSRISEQEIDRIAQGFIETGFFDLSVAKYVYAEKKEHKYEISISVIQGIENDKETLKAFIDLRTEMDNYFPNNKVELNLVVDNLDNVVETLK